MEGPLLNDVRKAAEARWVAWRSAKASCGSPLTHLGAGAPHGAQVRQNNREARDQDHRHGGNAGELCARAHRGERPAGACGPWFSLVNPIPIWVRCPFFPSLPRRFIESLAHQPMVKRSAPRRAHRSTCEPPFGRGALCLMAAPAPRKPNTLFIPHKLSLDT